MDELYCVNSLLFLKIYQIKADSNHKNYVHRQLSSDADDNGHFLSNTISYQQCLLVIVHTFQILISNGAKGFVSIS